jgi:anthranilate synthase component 2
MILVIDNYDSFTYNLVQYFGELGVELQVYRNDRISVQEAAALKPSHIVISPGPGTPDDSGISNDLIRELGAETPILGVCLGHQCICHVHGADIVRADVLMHGKTSLIHHDGEGVFKGLPEPFEATRYHSLIVDPQTVPEEILVTANTDASEIMGVRHREKPLHGVQFHPESILSREGKQLLENFLKL